jgi:hypothetical protein
MRSTGLGKTELKAHISSIEKMDDSILFKVKTTEPVRWEVRNLFQQKDIPKLVGLLLKPSNVAFLFKALFKKSARSSEPEHF